MNDLKFACRQLLKNPGFTAVAALGSDTNAIIHLPTQMRLPSCRRSSSSANSLSGSNSRFASLYKRNT